LCGPAAAKALREAGANAVTLANNHILDAGPSGVLDTIDACHAAGVRAFGAGNDRVSAELPLFIELSGVRVALLAMAEEEFCGATATSAGAAILDPIHSADRIRAARSAAAVVIAVVHGGNEYAPTPSPRCIDWYRSLVDAGADAVISHHPHVLQGAELYNGRPIVYSLGNFAFRFRAAMPRGWDRGAVARLAITSNGVRSCELFATRGNRDGRTHLVSLANQEDIERTRSLFADQARIIADEQLARAMHDCFCTQKASSYLALLSQGATKHARSSVILARQAVRHLSPHYALLAASNLIGAAAQWPARNRTDTAAMLNLLRCPAHYEALLRIFEMMYARSGPSADEMTEFARLTESLE
jgi:poly-gamma-glutamate synthesis protein (capsule biosynthesis protein)